MQGGSEASYRMRGVISLDFPSSREHRRRLQIGEVDTSCASRSGQRSWTKSALNVAHGGSLAAGE